MRIISGIMSLAVLHSYVNNDDPEGKSLHGNSPPGRIYGKQAKVLSEQIANQQGFYSWGRFDEGGQWKNI